MRCSTAASAPTDSMARHSSRTCASDSSVPIEDRSSSAATGSDVSASSTASASSTVRLPDRRSSPDGLPVTAGSPNTPSTSSRSWKATPRSVPTSWKIACTSGRSAAAAAPSCKRAGDGVGRGLVGVDGHRRRHRRRTAGFGDDVEILAAEHFGADVGPDPLNASLRIRGELGGGDDVVGPHQGEIAEQDRRRHPELVGRSAPAAVAVRLGEQPVHGGQAAAGVGVVDHVVVHQGACVQQLQRREQPQDGRVGGVVGRRPRANPSRRMPAAAACRRAARIPRALRSGRRSRCRCRRSDCGVRRDTPAVGRSRRWPTRWLTVPLCPRSARRPFQSMFARECIQT